MDGSDIDLFVSVGIDLLEGLAVDWIGRNLYWADGRLNRIEVAHLDTGFRRAVIWLDIESPHSVAVDPCEG